ncbi:hypothetical protein BDZ89DRAFT_1098331 [Hymenopellis radicata]|nr:hypothetical protein BDZ89DRAFT_1098331 [Hymenopellis radicata]
MAPLDSPHLSLPTYKTTSKARLQALYSDILPQKAANPAAFHANVEWWRRTLEDFVSEGLQTNSSDRLVLNASRSLSDALRVDGVGSPLDWPTPNASPALPALIPKSAFFSLNQSIYASSSILSTLPSLIASYLIAKPLWWALEQMGIVGQDGLFSSSDNRKWEGEYVVLRLIERAGENFATCVGLASNTAMSRADAIVVLKYLERDKKAVFVDKEVRGTVEIAIKFVATHESAQLTAVDKGILELKVAVANMQTQVEQLHNKVDSLTQRASDALKQKRKPMALSCIRSRKAVQDLLTKRLTALDNLEGTLLSVEAAAGDIDIMSSYAQSTATLKMILAHPSLQRETIDETMEALADANADAREIDEAIRDGVDIAGGATFDEDELEQELQGLLEEKMAEAEAEAIAKKHANGELVGKNEREKQEVPQSVESGRVPVLST